MRLPRALVPAGVALCALTASIAIPRLIVSYGEPGYQRLGPYEAYRESVLVEARTRCPGHLEFRVAYEPSMIMCGTLLTVPEQAPRWTVPHIIDGIPTYAETHAWGWPRPAVYCRREHDVRELGVQPMALLTDATLLVGPKPSREERGIVWSGLAINLGLFAGVTYVPLSLRLIGKAGVLLRGQRRRRRGLCPKCGYDLTALTADRCPECGGVKSPISH